MSARGVRLVVLCEDDEHRRFASYAFRGLGRHYRTLRTITCPAGRGSAESWVRKRYAEEVAAHRRKASSQHGLALVVVIDADKQTVDERHEQLAAALEHSGSERRGAAERIVIWVPKRHIETWVAYLSGRDANEEDDYKHAVADADYRPPAARFVDRYRSAQGRPPGLLPSIVTAYTELDRVEK